MARNPHSWQIPWKACSDMSLLSLLCQWIKNIKRWAWLNRGMIWGCKVSINVFMFFINSTSIIKFKRAMKGNSADFRWFHCWSVSWYIQYIRISSRATSSVRSKHLSCWLVVGTSFIFPYIGKNHPNWLSYFSEGLKPPTSLWVTFQYTAVDLMDFLQGLQFHSENVMQAHNAWGTQRPWKIPEQVVSA